MLDSIGLSVASGRGARAWTRQGPSERLSVQVANLVCLTILVLSVVFFVNHCVKLYAELDYAARDLGHSDLTDFFVFYSSARFLWDGGAASNLYDAHLLKTFQLSLGSPLKGLHPFNYPPTYLFIIWPLGGLSYAVGLIIWQFLTVTIFASTAKMAGLRLFEIVAAIVAPVTVFNISAGQNGNLTSALLIGGLALLARRQVAAGGLFGLLTVKPHMGLLVPVVCLAQRRWWAMAAAAGVTLVLVGASILVFGLTSWKAYFDFLVGFSTQIQAQSNSNFMKYSATILAAEQVMGLPKSLAYAIQIAVSCGVGAAVYWAYRRSQDEILRLVLLLVGVSLATPFGFLYDLPFMGVVVILLVRLGLQSGFLPFEPVCLAAAWAIPFLGIWGMERGVPLAPWIHLLLFCFILARFHLANKTELKRQEGYTRI